MNLDSEVRHWKAKKSEKAKERYLVMEERAKVLRERMKVLISNFSKSDSYYCIDYAGGIVIYHFDRLINTKLSQLNRDSSYQFLHGFVWSMFYMGVLDGSELSAMVDELVDLSKGV